MKKLEGGNYGFKKLCERPNNAGYSEKLDSTLRTIFEQVKPHSEQNYIPTIINWKETLSQNTNGLNILRLAEMIKELNGALYELLLHELNYNNAATKEKKESRLISQKSTIVGKMARLTPPSAILRRKPEIQASSIRSLASGTRMKILNIHGEWLEVETEIPKKTGYVMKKWLVIEG